MHISYQFNIGGSTSGFGDVTITLALGLRSAEDIDVIKQTIREGVSRSTGYNNASIVILSMTSLGEPTPAGLATRITEAVAQAEEAREQGGGLPALPAILDNLIASLNRELAA